MTGAHPLDYTFTTVLLGDIGPNNWSCAIMTDSKALLGTGKAVKVVATIDGEILALHCCHTRADTCWRSSNRCRTRSASTPATR